MEDVAKVALHDRHLGDGAEEAAPFQLVLEEAEEALHHLARGRRRALAHGETPGVALRGAQPLVADEQHRLRQVQRTVGRINRKGDDGVGRTDLVVVHAGAFGSEQDAVALAGAQRRRGLRHRFGRRADALLLAALARGRGPDEVEVGDGGGNVGVELGRFEQVRGAGSRGNRRLGVLVGARPAVAWGHQAKVGKPEIGHGAGAHADVHGELRPHKDHGGTAGQRHLRVVRSRPGQFGSFLMSRRRAALASSGKAGAYARQRLPLEPRP